MKSIILFVSLAAIIGCISCKKEKIDNGVTTILRGNVSDPTRGINISGYKIVLEKKVRMSYSGWVSQMITETIAEVYTDNNGEYLISFNDKLEPGQEYYLVEQYYGSPYYHESTISSGPIVAGATNVINMTAWRPIELKLNVQVMNNHTPPLNVRNVLAATNQTLLNVESIYQQNTTGTYILRSRPNSDINIIFYYTVNYASPTPTTHQKIMPYRTTLDSTTTLNYVVDCSTF